MTPQDIIDAIESDVADRVVSGTSEEAVYCLVGDEVQLRYPDDIDGHPLLRCSIAEPDVNALDLVTSSVSLDGSTPVFSSREDAEDEAERLNSKKCSSGKANAAAKDDPTQPE